MKRIIDLFAGHCPACSQPLAANAETCRPAMPRSPAALVTLRRRTNSLNWQMLALVVVFVALSIIALARY